MRRSFHRLSTDTSLSERQCSLSHPGIVTLLLPKYAWLNRHYKKTQNVTLSTIWFHAVSYSCYHCKRRLFPEVNVTDASLVSISVCPVEPNDLFPYSILQNLLYLRLLLSSVLRRSLSCSFGLRIEETACRHGGQQEFKQPRRSDKTWSCYLGGWARGYQLLAVKTQPVTKC